MVRQYSRRDPVVRKLKETPHEGCPGGLYEWSNYCGAYVCSVCQEHKGLARCYCGWNLSRGERLEDDIGEATFDGESWDVDY